MSAELADCVQDLSYTDDHATDYKIKRELADVIHDLCAFALDCDKRIGKQETGLDGKK